MKSLLSLIWRREINLGLPFPRGAPLTTSPNIKWHERNPVCMNYIVFKSVWRNSWSSNGHSSLRWKLFLSLLYSFFNWSKYTLFTLKSTRTEGKALPNALSSFVTTERPLKAVQWQCILPQSSVCSIPPILSFCIALRETTRAKMNHNSQS